MSHWDLIDLILLDHQRMKDCLGKLKVDDFDSQQKFLCSKELLEILNSHMNAEEQVLYSRALRRPKLHRKFLQSFEEHEVIRSRLRELLPEVKRSRRFSENLEVKLKVLANFVSQHLNLEEKEILPEVENNYSTQELAQMGLEYSRARGLRPDELVYFEELRKNDMSHKNLTSG